MTWRWAIVISALALTTACGGKAAPEASGSSAPSPTADPAPSSTSATTPSTPAIDPNIPAAARAHTPAGAEAFTRYFFARFNASWQEARPELLRPLASPSCKACESFVETAANYRAKNQHYRGVPFDVTAVQHTMVSQSAATIIVTGNQAPGAIVDATGRVIQRTEHQEGRFAAHVAWNASGWVVSEVKVLK